MIDHLIRILLKLCHLKINSRPIFLLSNKTLVQNKDHALHPKFLSSSSFTLDFNKIHNERIYVKNLQDSINASIEKLYYLQIKVVVAKKNDS
jgi:hypothetical protein